MKKQILLIAALVLMGSVFLNRTDGHTYSNNAPANRTGAPGHQECSGCHGNISPMISNIGFLDPTGAMEYVPGTTYDMEVTIGAPTQNIYGFSMVSWDANNSSVGTWIASGSNTNVDGSGEYIEHQMAPSNQGSNFTYTFQWTAPAAGTGDVTFYAGMVAGNGNGSTSGDGGKSESLTITEAAPMSSSVIADLTILLEGAYLGNGEMRTDGNMFIPLSSPYSDAPYNAPPAMATSGVPSNAVDWILVEVRGGTPSPTAPRATVTVLKQSAFLLDDGSIVGEDGNALELAIDDSQSYHIAIRHRNHLDVLSATSIAPQAGMLTYDFTTGEDKAFGVSQMKLESDNSASMFAGDYTADQVIQTTDFDVWQANPAVLNTYTITDGNVDGVVQVTDYDTWFENKAKIGNHEMSYD